VLGIGTGFTGSRALGKKAMRWADVAAYVEALRALLRGETVQWDGAAIRMLHPDGFAPERPIEVPIVLATAGPKGEGVARRLADGVFVTRTEAPDGFTWAIQLAWGTVLEDGEAPTSDRVFEAAGPAAAVAYHGLYEYRGSEAVAALPNGAAWADRIEAVPEAERHLAIHDGHLATVNPIDREVLPREAVEHLTLTGAPDAVRAKLEGIEAAGVTELAYQPCGPDIPRELEAFMRAAR
jgi:5,10-methylenetetrahydromethanopterin reductase